MQHEDPYDPDNNYDQLMVRYTVLSLVFGTIILLAIMGTILL